MLLDDLPSLVLGARNLRLCHTSVRRPKHGSVQKTYLSPAARPTALSVLDQQMRSPDLPIVASSSTLWLRASAMVDSHVVLELLDIGTGRGLPSRLAVGGVEVVREVLGVGVADFPALGQAGIGL